MLLWLFINKLHRLSSVEYRRQRYINNSFREYLCKEFDKEKDMRYSLTLQSFAIASLVSFVILPSVLLSLCLFNKHILSLVSFVIIPSVHYVFSISTFCLSFPLLLYLLFIMSLCLFNKHIMSSVSFVIMSSPHHSVFCPSVLICQYELFSLSLPTKQTKE